MPGINDCRGSTPKVIPDMRKVSRNLGNQIPKHEGNGQDSPPTVVPLGIGGLGFCEHDLLPLQP